MNTQPQRLGKYELQERLGQGGMAEVWKAFDPQLRRYVAIKFLHPDLRSTPDFMARFIREGQAIASLRHPNIVQVYDFLTSSEQAQEAMAYMVMDYVEGQTLAHYIRHASQTKQFLSPEEIVRLLTPIALAIDYAHEHGMLHRDIKPANILLDARNTRHNRMGEPILTDFGIAKVVGSATMTEAGTSLGTPLYISPEQVRGLPSSEKSDIYSFGVMAYEICVDAPPFRGDTAYMIMLKHVQDPPPPPSQVNPALPAAVDDVFARVLAKDPEARFPSASAMTAALAQAFGVVVPEPIRYAISSSSADEATIMATNAASHEETVRASNTAHDALPTQEADQTNVPTQLMSQANASSKTVGQTNVPTQLVNQAGALADTRPAPDPLIDTPPPAIRRANPVSSAGASTEPTIAPIPQLAPANKRNRLLTIVIPVVLLVLILSGLGTFVLSRRSSATSSGPANKNVTGSATIVGQAAFVSSGQLMAQGMPAINDGMQIRLEHVANPSAGNSYYAWLQDNDTETRSLLLGPLTVNQGVATLTYADKQHTDLLAMASNFLVTEESTSIPPNAPSLDKRLWRYVGALPQTRSPKDGFSYLDHIRHLLSNEPNLAKLQLQGGVDYWFLNGTQQVQNSAIEVRDHVNIPTVRQQIANIVYALDGKCAAGELANAPINTAENAAIAHATSVGLLDCVQMIEPPGHLTHISRHLIGISQAPGAPKAQIQRAIDINKYLDIENAWLKQVRTDALQLAGMDDTHLGQAHSLRNDLAVQSNNVVNGAVDPTTQALIPSAQQIANTIELLANFDITPYTGA